MITPKQTEQNHIENLDESIIKKLIKEKRLISYQQLCELLKIPYLRGNSKSKQLQQIYGLFEIEKLGTKYRFIRVLSPEEQYFYDKREKYLPYVELILSELFYDEKEPIIFFSTLEILAWSKMVNENYKIAKNGSFPDKKAICSINQFNLTEFQFYINTSFEKLYKPLIDGVLKSLDSRKSITSLKGYKIYKKIGTYKEYSHILKSDDMGKVIAEIESNTYTQLGIKNKQDFFNQSYNIKQEYYTICNQKCKEQTGYDGFYSCDAIIVHKERTGHNINLIHQELNNKILDRTLTAKQLDRMTKIDLKMFTEAMISIESKYNFKADIEESKRLNLY